MYQKMPRKTTKKAKEEKSAITLYPPKPREKLTVGQEIYCYYPPTNSYLKRIYVKEGKEEGWVVTKDENDKRWLVNLEHLHNTVLTKEEYEKLGQVDN